MPTYTYRCNECEHEFDVRQRFSDDPLTECPSCEGEVRRVVNSVGIVFKGSGFYVTDNRNGTAKATNGAAEKSESGVEKSTSDTSKPTKSEKKSKEST